MEFTDLELWALSACIVEAKFNGAWRDMDVPDSPIVAELSRKIRDALHAGGRFGSDSTWRAWRDISPEREEWRIALKFMRFRKGWQTLEESARRDYARRVLAPFELSEELLTRFLTEASVASEDV